MKDGIYRLDPRDAEAVADVARLHADLLPGSPISRLGPDFVRRFYYRKLVETGLICCSIYYHQGTAGGFIAYTRYPSTFMAAGLRRHWVYLAAVLALSVARDPRRLKGIAWTLNHMRKQTADPRQLPPGELLSLGVLPDFRSARYIRATGRRISMALYDDAVEYFRSANVTEFRAVVEKQNREALLFYNALECRFHDHPEGNGTTVEVLCSTSD